MVLKCDFNLNCKTDQQTDGRTDRRTYPSSSRNEPHSRLLNGSSSFAFDSCFCFCFDFCCDCHGSRSCPGHPPPRRRHDRLHRDPGCDGGCVLSSEARPPSPDLHPSAFFGDPRPLSEHVLPIPSASPHTASHAPTHRDSRLGWKGGRGMK